MSDDRLSSTKVEGTFETLSTLPSSPSSSSSLINDNVKVCVRARGLLGSNEVGKKTCMTALPSQNVIMVDAKPDSKLFSFDYVADENTSQEQLFENVALPLVDSFIDGYNGCIFAYGQTGSGKSYTIMGEQHTEDDSQQGLIPRTFHHLFNRLYELQEDDNSNQQKFKCTLSFLEIYNEQILDLFVDSSHRQQLSIREDLKKGIYVEGLREIEISDTSIAMELLQLGIANRHVAETAMNSNSSRSHSVLTINLESTLETEDGLTKTKYSRLSLIDLAGSERQKSTEAAGSRLKEAGSINKSLSCLGNVIRSLVDVANGKPRHIQYRDSKLTFLLKDSLGGNSKTYIIATVSPSEIYYGESISTLQFAQRAKLVRNLAIVNEEASGNITLLQMEIRKLKEELYRARTSATATPVAVSSSSIDSQLLSQFFNTVDPQFQPYELRIHELEVLLSRSLEREEQIVQQLQKVEQSYRYQKLLIEKKDYFLQSNKFVLRLRESHIARLEDKIGVLYSTIEEELREEILELRKQVRLHPEITRYAIENLELRDILRSYEMTFSEGKDSYEDQVANMKQQIKELVCEVKQLMAFKHEHLLNSRFSSESNNNDSDNSVVVEVYQSPYMKRQRIKESVDAESNRWELEKKEIEQQYQQLHARNIQLESELQTIRQSNESLQNDLSNLHSSHQDELKKMKESNDNIINTMKKAYSNKLNNQKNSEDQVLKEMKDGLIKLEEENNEIKNAKMKLLSEIFEKNEEMNRLRLELESMKLSSQKMTEVFISTPLRDQQQQHISQNGDYDDLEKETGPIKFNLSSEQDNTDKQQTIDDQSQKIAQLDDQLKSLYIEIEKKDYLLNSFQEENNELQELNDLLSIEIDKMNLFVTNQELPDSSNPSTISATDLDQKIKQIVQKKEEEIKVLINEKSELEKQIKHLNIKINNQLVDFKEMESSYKQELLDLAARYEVNGELLAAKEMENKQLHNSIESLIMSTKSRMLEEFEVKQQKLSIEIKEEYNQNIKHLKSEILELQVKLLTPSATTTDHHQQIEQTNEWINKYNILKYEYDDLYDKSNEYHSRLTVAQEDIKRMSNKLQRFKDRDDYIDESEIIVISSDDEDYVPPKAEEIEDDFDYSKIEIKKCPNITYEVDDDEDDDKSFEEDKQRLNISELDSTISTTQSTLNNLSIISNFNSLINSSYFNNNNNSNNTNNISTTINNNYNNRNNNILNNNSSILSSNSNNDSSILSNNNSNITNRSNNTTNSSIISSNNLSQAISNNLSVLSQISELEKSLHQSMRFDTSKDDE